MIVALQIVGIVAVLVGLVTIGVGIPVKEFSFGNTLIVAGTVGMCTGLILLGLSVVATEIVCGVWRATGIRAAEAIRAKTPMTTKSRRNPSDVVTKSCPRCSQQRWKQRRQIHRDTEQAANRDRLNNDSN